jgi:hypothetical protein
LAPVCGAPVLGVRAGCRLHDFLPDKASTGCSISHARVLRCSKSTNLLKNETKFGIKKTADTSSFYLYFSLAVFV